MPGCRSRLVAAALAVAASAGTTGTAAAAEDAPHHVLFSFTDRDITESSGLVDAGRLVFTMNDSGHGPVLFAVDPRSGATVARSTYSPDRVTDVEAIAPGPGGAVWAGDIGDNNAGRAFVSVYRTVPLPGPARSRALAGGRDPVREDVASARFRLAYPDGPRDAETLLVHPRTGRVYLVSKNIAGGTVYQAPRTLDAGRVNRLSVLARVPGLVTDGAFFPDGRHVILRTYGTASVFTFPGFALLGTVRLPPQQQGEGIAVGRRGRILVSSEGAYSPVLQVFLPPALARSAGLPPASSLVPAVPPPTPVPAHRGPGSDPLSTGDGAGAWAALGVLAATLVGWLWFTASRRRGRRTP